MTDRWRLVIVVPLTLIGALMLFKIVTLSENLKDAQKYIASLETLRDNLIEYKSSLETLRDNLLESKSISDTYLEEQPEEWGLVIVVPLALIGAFILFKLVRLSARLTEAKKHITSLETLRDNLIQYKYSYTHLEEQLEDTENVNNRLIVNISKLDKSLKLSNNEVAHLKAQNVSLKQSINDITNKFTAAAEQQISNFQQTINDQIRTAKATEEKLKNEAKQQISNLQQTINDLTEKLTETGENLAKESRQSAGNLKMLINERQQSKEAKQALKKKFTEAKTQNDQLERELIQLKKTKLLAIQAALDDLNTRADTISKQIPKIVRHNNRDDYMSKFKKLKEENDRMMLDLKTVTFTTRLYQSDHDALLKTQEEADRGYGDNLKKMNRITADCRRLITEYNSSIPDKFLKTIADHTRDLDMLAKINFNSDLTNEVAIEEKVLNGLLKEREMIESILRVEKSNNILQTKNDKPNNLQYINNLSTSNTYHLMIYNMVEASDHLSDIISFETFMHHATGKFIKCFGVDRFGAPKKIPRPAKITLNSLQDFEDVLNSKAEKEYSHLRIEKFVPNKKQGKTNEA